jgi:hypothetical protein
MSADVEIVVGVVVERHKAQSQWLDHVWRPSAVLAGEPAAAPWTVLEGNAESTVFYAGPATISLHRAETENYRSNLASGSPRLWVVLSPTNSEPPYAIHTVTADPAEGEAMTETGTNLVDNVAMPPTVQKLVEEFVAAYHVERPFYKRPQNRADPEALARRSPDQKPRTQESKT